MAPWHLLHLLLRVLPPEEDCRREKQQNIERGPRKQNTKVATNHRMRIKYDRSRCFNYIVQWPRIAPFEEAGFERNSVKRSADVCDDPKD